MGALTIIGLIVLAIFVIWVLYRIGFLGLLLDILSAITGGDSDGGGFGGGSSGGGGSSSDW